MAGLLLLGILLRLGVVLAFDKSTLSPAEETYTGIAHTWTQTFKLEQGGIPTAEVMPLYPLFLGVFHLLIPETWGPVLVFQALLGGLIPWFVYRTVWRLARKPRVAWATLAIGLFFPPLMLLPLQLAPYVLTGFFVAAGIWVLSFVVEENSHLLFFMGSAVLFALGMYCSGVVFFLVPVLAFWAGVRAYYPGVGIACAIILCLSMIVFLLPWAGRNFLSLGHLIPLSTGYAADLDRSLAELMGRSGESAQASESSGETVDGNFEVIRYQESLASCYRHLTHFSSGSIGKLLIRGLSFWIGPYTSVLPGSAKGVADSMIFRVAVLTGSILVFIFACIGWAASLPRLNLWLVWLGLGTVVLLGAIMDAAGTWVLPYWPYYGIFVAWGGIVVWDFMARTSLLDFSNRPKRSKEEQRPEGPLPFRRKTAPSPPVGDPAEAPFRDPEAEPENRDYEGPLWPVEENPEPRLGPIRKPRLNRPTLKFRDPPPEEEEEP
jgi:hypothetical protein